MKEPIDSGRKDSIIQHVDITLQGRHIRLEPLGMHHLPGLMKAASEDRSLYRWSSVPEDEQEAGRYIEAALAAREGGTALPFATVRSADNVVIGSTRFFDLERWGWPPGHVFHGREGFDVCEIGYTWLGSSAIRTPANTEAKLLMLTHAFETWKVHRVCFHTDARNTRSRAALERIGGVFEGTLRAHRLAADATPRDSVRYSIMASEWTSVRERLLLALTRP